MTKFTPEQLKRRGVVIVRIPALGADPIVNTIANKLDMPRYNIIIDNSGERSVDVLKRKYPGKLFIVGKKSAHKYFVEGYTSFVRHGVPSTSKYRGLNPEWKFHEVASDVFPTPGDIAEALVSDNPDVVKIAETVIKLTGEHSKGYKDIINDVDKQKSDIIYVYDLEKPVESFNEIKAMFQITEDIELSPGPAVADVLISENARTKLTEMFSEDIGIKETIDTI